MKYSAKKGQPPVLQEKWLAFFHGFAGIKPQPLLRIEWDCTKAFHNGYPLLLQLFGYKETPFLNEVTGEVVYSYVQSQTAQDAVRIIFCTLPIMIFVISIIFAFKANMGRDRFNAIKEELAKREKS